MFIIAHHISLQHMELGYTAYSMLKACRCASEVSMVLPLHLSV
uniref:Uncharacterized protein n=1 Tax=Anguilla anguilla TaxID=7936 RepID=A0A0E9SJE1_ANGAN